MPTKLDDFTKGYIECALWSTNDNSDPSGGEPLYKNYDISDLSEKSLAEIIAECADFQQAQAEDLALAYELYTGTSDGASAEAWGGHNFWLTKNGHGTGWWDRGLGKVGDRLTEAAHVYSSTDIYVGDDGKLHI